MESESKNYKFPIKWMLISIGIILFNIFMIIIVPSCYNNHEDCEYVSKILGLSLIFPSTLICILFVIYHLIKTFIYILQKDINNII